VKFGESVKRGDVVEVESFLIGLLCGGVCYLYFEVWKFKRREEARQPLRG